MAQRADGCGFLLATCLLLGVGLFVNATIAMALYTFLKPGLPAMWQSSKVSAFFIFAVPIGLVVVQWWLLDRVIDFLSSHDVDDEAV